MIRQSPSAAQHEPAQPGDGGSDGAQVRAGSWAPERENAMAQRAAVADLVVLLKEAGGEKCKYRAALERPAQGGCPPREVLYCPVIAFEADLQGVEQLKRALTESSTAEGRAGELGVWAVVLTSPRAAQAVAQLVEGFSPEQRQRLRGAKWFAVGKGTASRLPDLGCEVFGSESGNAASLLEVIARERDASETRPLLFAAGNIRRDTIPLGLHERAIRMVEICVYRTIPRADLELPPEVSLDSAPVGTKIWCVFFSPSGVKSLESSRTPLARDVSLVAIGETTARALRDSFVSLGRRILVSSEPTPAGILRVIDDGIEGAGDATRSDLQLVQTLEAEKATDG